MVYTPRKKLIFQADAHKDVAGFFAFVADAAYDNGRNIKWAILNKYPGCKKWFRDSAFIGRRADIVRFAEEKYIHHAQSINANLIHYEHRWRAVEPKFDSLVRKIFGDYSWPKGKYIAYTTIWGIFPRFLNDKTFQIPYRFRNKRYVNVVIAHELLHFIFYEYFYEHYPRYRDDKHSMFSWHVSEIFNNVIQNSVSWQEVFKLPSMVDPAHEKVVIKLSRIHTGEPCWRINELIRDIIVSVKEKRKAPLY